MKTGDKVVMRKVGACLNGFTAYKMYTVVSGHGEANMSKVALSLGIMTHNERTFNLVDDNGETRFCTDAHFRLFNDELKGLFQ
ncbi:hypothetical protein Erwinia_phage_Fougasse_00075 [Erwinia phage Fougasse]|nr:hypothetical protein Erwinia_phage_Fougasse_00075 [Erwinia phage Fougasse]WJN64271.1 hypothetical protein Erwinia_phage_Nougat_00075 [Erwinia phage Nougat]